VQTIKGSFEVKANFEPPFDDVEGVSLGRATFEKRFSGALEATGQVFMLAARGPVQSSAGYVAIERVTGSLDGRRGSFVLQHNGIADRGQHSLTVTVVPDSGTAELVGLRGKMTIDIVDGRHLYTFDYEFIESR
jgi:hypothetical protein